MRMTVLLTQMVNNKGAHAPRQLRQQSFHDLLNRHVVNCVRKEQANAEGVSLVATDVGVQWQGSL